jgi:hypothetical protein
MVYLGLSQTEKAGQEKVNEKKYLFQLNDY